jgi:hypothetical protein
LTIEAVLLIDEAGKLLVVLVGKFDQLTGWKRETRQYNKQRCAMEPTSFHDIDDTTHTEIIGSRVTSPRTLAGDPEDCWTGGAMPQGVRPSIRETTARRSFWGERIVSVPAALV